MTSPADSLPPLAAIGPVADAPAIGARTGAAESPAFRALLESLERVARSAAPPETVDDPLSLQRAIEHADDGFREVMDLRRRLEDAFRQRLP